MVSKKIISLIIAMTITSGMLSTVSYAAVREDNTLISEQAEENLISVMPFVENTKQNYEEYEKVFKVTGIKSYSNNGGQYSSSSINKAFDGDLSTHWETGRPNNSNFTNEVIVTFEDVETFNRIVYGARNDAGNKGFATKFSIYSSLTEDEDDFTLVGRGNATRGNGLYEFKFNNTQFKRIKFVFDECADSWASAREMMFFKEDNLEDKLNEVFTDGTQVKLSDEYNSFEALETLEKEIINHPFRDVYKENINLAKDILTNPNKYDDVSIYTCEQRGDSIEEQRKYKLPRPTYSLYSYGKYILLNETIKVYVDADKDGVLPKIVLGEVSASKSNWATFIDLKPGLNLITAPPVTVKEPSAIYIYNGARESQQAYAPRIRIEGGTSYPVYRHNETSP